jgi:apolipoprotein N-acyltransferase
VTSPTRSPRAGTGPSVSPAPSHAPPRDSRRGLGPRWRGATRRRQLPPQLRCGLEAVIVGVGLSTAFPPLAWWPVAPLGVAAATALLTARGGRPLRRAAWLGFLIGAGEFFPLLFWLHVVTPLAWIVLALAESAYFAAMGTAIALVGRFRWWPAAVPAIWVAQEAVRDRWPLDGFAWGRLAFSQPRTALTGFAALGGAPLVTFVVALVGCLALVAVRDVMRSVRARRAGASGRAGGSVGPAARLVSLTAAVVAIAGVFLGGAIVARPTSGAPLRVAIVQGNVPHPGTHFLGRAEQVLDDHLAETAQLVARVRAGQTSRPDIVVWPENASDVDPLRDASARARIQAAADAIGVPILVGAVLDAGPDHVTNTGVVWNPATGPAGSYTKRHLVPFGEYIPWRGLISHLTSLTKLVPDNFVPGHGTGAVDIGATRLADVICFEVAFDGAVRSGVIDGGRFIVVQTNNATYMGTSEVRQQLAMSQLRAVEHGRAVVVAATSGISAVIAPDGRVVTTTREMTPAVVEATIPQRTSLTVADHLGVLPEVVLGILGVLAAAVAAGASRRRSRRPPEPREPTT